MLEKLTSERPGYIGAPVVVEIMRSTQMGDACSVVIDSADLNAPMQRDGLNDLVREWLTARSLARGLPRPVPDYGGYRVDTNTAAEVRRWVFGATVPGIALLGQTIREPRHVLKLCGSACELGKLLPPEWQVSEGNCFMEISDNRCIDAPIPPTYHLQQLQHGAVTRVEIRTDEGQLAASGYSAETDEAFIYDRIQTDAQHRRRGLARAVMVALGSCRRSSSTRQLLVATAEGERLYSAMGWRKLSPYSTARLPELVA